MTEHILVILAFVLSAVLGFIFIPIILNFCKEKKLYDIPDSRKVHSKAIPRLGGLCFLPSMFFAFVATMLTFNNFSGETELSLNLWSVYFFVSLLLVYSIGFIDDLIGLGAKTKFTVQIIAALLMPLAYLYINNLYGFLGIYEVNYFVGAALTVLVIVFITNAINLIDGIDGLSASISFIALTGFMLLFLNEDVWRYSALIASLMGVLVAFLYFNLFGKVENNRKIFMGDSGSLTLGFILGFLAVKYSMNDTKLMAVRTDALLASFTLLVVPVFDVFRVSLNRMIHRKPIFSADKNHIHHKLMRTGLNQHQTLMAIIALSLFYISVNSILVNYMSSTIVVVIDIVIWLVFNMVVNMAIRRNGQPVFLVRKDNE
jgi:UDP-N-acetylmuramyl pentapeptide phosphotransferase/UDP-N-acetylglucosamine-1-phosphate transferase